MCVCVCAFPVYMDSWAYGENAPSLLKISGLWRLHSIFFSIECSMTIV